jgi:hypothetical protein
LTDEVCCPVNYHLGVNLDPNLLVRVTGKHPSIVSPWTERLWWQKPQRSLTQVPPRSLVTQMASRTFLPKYRVPNQHHSMLAHTPVRISSLMLPVVWHIHRTFYLSSL